MVSVRSKVNVRLYESWCRSAYQYDCHVSDVIELLLAIETLSQSTSHVTVFNSYKSYLLTYCCDEI